jgi:pilus assembly protein CpaE
VSEPLRALVALDIGVSREAVQTALPSGSSGIEIVGIVEGLEETWTILQSTATDLLVIACAGYSDRALFLIDGAAQQRPERPVIVLAEGSSNGFVQRAFEAGADDFITLPETPDRVYFALHKAIARKRGAALAAGSALAQLICILGPKGGTGKTLTAVNLSVALAEAGRRVAVVDLDLQFGDLGLALGLAPDRTIYDLANAGGTLDAEKIEGFLMPHSSGIRALLAPTRPDQASTVTVEFLRNVYGALREVYDVVVVDTPPGFVPEVIASIDSSTSVCMVGMLDALSLKNTKLGLETLDLMGYRSDRVTLVLNRADTRVGITRDDVEAIVGRRPDIFVPSNRDIPRAVNDGLAIVEVDRKSEAARAFRSLAAVYAGSDQPAALRTRRFALSRRRG